jgi:hypothetical protein
VASFIEIGLRGITLSAALLLGACASDVAPRELVALTAPGSARVRMTAPGAVSRVAITVSGPSIAEPIEVELEPDAWTWIGIIAEIPAGPRTTFHARALDDDGTLLYEGEAGGIEIRAGEMVSLTLVLQRVDSGGELAS